MTQGYKEECICQFLMLHVDLLTTQSNRELINTGLHSFIYATSLRAQLASFPARQSHLALLRSTKVCTLPAVIGYA